MLPRTQLYLELGNATSGKQLCVRVVVLVAEHDLFWANSAIVFSTLQSTLISEWRHVLALPLTGTGRRVDAGIAFTVPGVLKMHCQLTEADNDQLVMVRKAGVAEPTWSPMCSHEIVVRLTPPVA